jgi:rod shape-determining protein MreC
LIEGGLAPYAPSGAPPPQAARAIKRYAVLNHFFLVPTVKYSHHILLVVFCSPHHSLPMRPERYSYSYASSGGGGRSLRARLWLVGMVLLALVLLIMARLHHPLVGNLRTHANDMIAPVMEAVTLPVRGMRNLMSNKAALFNAYEENIQLRAENETLRHWQAVAQSLKVENEALRGLAGYRPVEAVSYVAAQVIAQSPSAYAGMLMINAGAEQGLISLQPVIDAYGLVGRVVEVGDRTARVLLLSDNASRVPVVTSDSRQHAILTGTGDELMRLTFVVGEPQNIKLGETVMTTSEGGLIPENVMVGTIFRRDATGLLVKPMRPLAQAEYVRVMVGK